jgi:UDP-N-acetylglucosamine:LPS N-acetylglucosamine transferase
VDTVIELSKNEKRQQTLRENISKMAVNNADEVIANEILITINKNQK